MNRRAINYLENESYFSNNKYNFSEIIKKYLGKDKIISLDVGAQESFNTDNFFHPDTIIFLNVYLLNQ